MVYRLIDQKVMHKKILGKEEKNEKQNVSVSLLSQHHLGHEVKTKERNLVWDEGCIVG